MKNNNEKPLVFVDTNVIVAYLRGEAASSRLFSPEILERVNLAIDPIVFQELLFINEAREHPEVFEKIQNNVRILDFDLAKADEYMPIARTIRDKIAHSNDILLLSSASACDYLVTYDRKLGEASRYLSPNKPVVVTPEQFLSRLESLV